MFVVLNQKVKNMFSFIDYLIRQIGRKADYTTSGVRVRYLFNMPGLRNFHLLPYKNRWSPLNVFKPHWTGSIRPVIRLQHHAK